MRFVHEVDSLEPNTITYETEPGQAGGVELDGAVPVFYVNQKGCQFLAKLFAQLALGQCSRGFHVHLGEGLDPEAPEVVRIVIE